MPSQKKLTAQQQRDKRSKIILAVLGLVLLAVLAFELPSMLGGKKTPAAASATTSASTTTGGTTTTGAPASAAAAAAPVNYQVAATAQPGQLTNFSRLHAKDPFHALVSTSTTGSSTGSSVGSSTGPSTTTPAKQTAKPPIVAFLIPKTKTPAAETGPLVLAAVLQLNGKRRVIPVGSSFPLVNPVFKLVAVGKGAIWITLVGGSFASGDQTLKIQLKHPVKLVNTTAGIDYLIGFTRMTAVHKALLPVTTTPATTTTTTTSSTTTTPPTTTTP
jgi:hypothetical protein